MTRLIDADALKEYIDCGHLRNPCEVCFSERDVVDLIDAQPTIDAVPLDGSFHEVCNQMQRGERRRGKSMTRLIDADSVYKWYLEAFKGQIKPNEIRFSMNDIRDNLENIPTIDAEPVRHGKWTADEILYTQGMTACSCCKTEYYRDDLYMVGNNAQGELPNYCPNCGARMDKDERD